ncbi:Hypothetical predicted protein [Xyrichtys novacula]|uniref:Uncharacterized protein n=1 Tax=Xyrichtys novacula TaxID=13765 RepID=A0AAV1FPW6_XYRNO|nr:Hypothetical predicted protein [Xyrichtys novacula]
MTNVFNRSLRHCLRTRVKKFSLLQLWIRFLSQQIHAVNKCHMTHNPLLQRFTQSTTGTIGTRSFKGTDVLFLYTPMMFVFKAAFICAAAGNTRRIKPSQSLHPVQSMGGEALCPFLSRVFRAEKLLYYTSIIGPVHVEELLETTSQTCLWLLIRRVKHQLRSRPAEVKGRAEDPASACVWMTFAPETGP